MNLLIRFFANLLKNLIFKNPMEFEETSILNMRVLPNDLDLNIHMNNGRYLTLMDIGRTDLTVRIGLFKKMLQKKWQPVATSVNVTFLKPLGPFEKFELHTKLLAWDDMWFYLEQKFIKDEKIYCHAIVKAVFMKGRKRILPIEVVKEVKGEEIPSPEFPNYLRSIIAGEDELINEIKKINKKS